MIFFLKFARQAFLQKKYLKKMLTPEAFSPSLYV